MNSIAKPSANFALQQRNVSNENQGEIGIQKLKICKIDDDVVDINTGASNEQESNLVSELSKVFNSLPPG